MTRGPRSMADDLAIVHNALQPVEGPLRWQEALAALRRIEEQLEVYATALRKIEETPWFLDTWNVGSAEVRRIARAALYPASVPLTGDECSDCGHEHVNGRSGSCSKFTCGCREWVAPEEPS